MNALSVKLPHDLYASLASEARRRNLTRSALVRDILAEAVARDADGQLPSCAELAGDLVGAFRSGRNDLAVARLAPVHGGRRVFGQDRGRFHVPEDFDAPLDDDLLRAFEARD